MAIIEGIKEKIYEEHERQHAMDAPRGYLGGSQVGHECNRKLWYEFRGCKVKKFSGRTYKIFETGNLEEKRIIRDLKNAGLMIYEINPETGKQFEFKEFGDHFCCHFDGVIENGNDWLLLEIKTHNQKSFDDLQKKGVLKSKPQHYAQMQVYMGLGELQNALYVAKNKNDEDYYFEEIVFSDSFFNGIMSNIQLILEAVFPPEKLTDDPNFFTCRFCDLNDVCHDFVLPAPNCRNCAHSTPNLRDGGWLCGKEIYNTPNCTHHLYIPHLISFAKPIEGGEDYAIYEMLHDKNINFANTASNGFIKKDIANYSSEQLSKTDYKLIGTKDFEALREELGAKML